MSRLTPRLLAPSLGAIVLTVVGAHCAAAPGSLERETTTLQDASGNSFRAEVCHIQVPEFRADPESRKIKLTFVYVHGSESGTRAPIVYLAGGPGSSASGIPMNPRGLSQVAHVLAITDMIFLDQRGTGQSEPDMLIASTNDVHSFLFADRKRAIDAARKLSADGIRQLRERGIDPRGYTTAESADDVNDIRIALGLEKVSLFGFSYGTHLGQAIIKRHGAHVERAALCGIEGLDETLKLPRSMDTQFEKLALLVRNDPSIGAQCPDLLGLLRRVLSKLEKNPMIVEVRHPETGETVQVPVGPYGLKLILRFDIGDASDLPVFPRLLHSIDQGDPSMLKAFVEKRIGLVSGLSGMTMLMDTASGATPERFALIAAQSRTSLFGEVVNFPMDDVHDIWNVNDLGEGFRAPFVSDVPVLLLSGTLDWNTPPYQAEHLRWGMTNAHHIIVENAGHEQILPQAEIQNALITFFSGQTPEISHLSLPPLQFAPLEGPSPNVRHFSIGQ